MAYYGVVKTSNEELMHYGVEGQKWGVRRYQNEDGSYKAGADGRYAPKTRGVYGINERHYRRKAARMERKQERRQLMADKNKEARKEFEGKGNKLISKVYGSNERYYTKRANKFKAKAKKANLYADMQRSAYESRQKKRAKNKVNKAVARSANVPMHTVKRST